MCGIAGFFDPSIPTTEAKARLGAMLHLIEHRGPDGEGTHFGSGGLAFGMRRLSIIDLAGGAQPIWNEDHSVAVVFNGEIYNYVELRAALEQDGHTFRTHSDTEVLVHLYEQHGVALVEKLRGMFGFAILDTRRRELLLARDHFGQKPLYWFADGKRLAFASELKSLLTLPFVARDLHSETLLDYATWASLPAPQTHFRHIRKLAAGTRLTFSLASHQVPEPERYWDFDFPETAEITDMERAADAVDAAIADSVQMHFRADVPVGVLLSSGLDSRIVTTYARKLHPEGVATFSVGYREAGNELEGARLTAEELGTRHHELQITGTDVGRHIDKLAWHLDEPIGDPAAFALWQVCAFARQHVKVLLSGEGADELFAGYDIKYRSHLHTLRRSNLMRQFSQFIGHETEPFPESRLGRLRRRAHVSEAAELVDLHTRAFPGDQRRPRGLTPDQLGRLRAREAQLGARCVRPQRDLLSTLLAYDVDWQLAESLLQKADKMSMAASIELRTPFVDVPLSNVAAKLDSTLKLGDHAGKLVLRKCLARHVAEPPARPKKGFPMPLGSWFRGELRDQLEADIFGPNAAWMQTLDRRTVRSAWDQFQASAWDGALAFYCLWLYEAWHRTVVRSPLPIV